MTTLSIIIPTLQKDITILNKLIDILDRDECVSEIIIIDNSTKGLSSNSDKVFTVIPKKNLFVNPAWNLGVEHAKNNIFALFNDDLLVCENFCSKVMDLIKYKEDFGALGMATDSVVNTHNPKIPNETSFFIEEDLSSMEYNWGCIIFGRKDIFKPIPNKIKIWCGDDFIRFNAKNQNLKVFRLQNAIINHIGSLSVNNSKIKKLCYKDCLKYAKIDPNMKNKEIYKKALKKTFLYKLTHLFN